MEDNVQRKKIQLSALDPYILENQVKPTEKVVSGQKWVNWGDANDYPDYLKKLYTDVPTLQAIINSVVDYICGDGVEGMEYVNRKGELLEDFTRKIALDYTLFGGISMQVIRSLDGRVLELYHIPFQWCRVNEGGDVVYVCKDFSKRWSRTKVLEYPLFGENDQNPTSVYYFKGNSQTLYPTPMWGASTLYAEIEREICKFHHNELNNNFTTSAIINFNNGVPDDEQKDEIEKKLNEKFTGHDNAGRVLISYNDSKENQATIMRLGSDDFANRYDSLAKRSREQLFISFRMTPNLAGLATESTGFNSEEYDKSFKLFNKTTIQPMQKVILRAFKRVYGDDRVSIKPFTINFNNSDLNGILEG